MATIEQDTDIVNQTLVDAENNGLEIDIRTPHVIRERPVIQQLRIPLYVNGHLKTTAELAELGLTIRNYTRLEVDTATYAGYYAANPDLAKRVREYKAHLDALGLPYTATTDDITGAVKADATLTEAEKLELGQAIKAVFDNIALNLQALEIPESSFYAWSNMPKLIRFLPAEQPPEPAQEG